MAHHEYETIVIIRPDLDDSVTYGIAEKLEGLITNPGGHLLIRDDWGKRRLAYPIRKQQKGHYILFNFLANPTTIEEFERHIRIDENIIRFLTVIRAEDVEVELRVKQAEEQRRLREEAEKARLEAEARAAAEAEARAEAEAAAQKYYNQDDQPAGA